MKSELKQLKRSFNIFVGVYLIIFSGIVSTIFCIGYLFNRSIQIEDYCRKTVHEKLAKGTKHPEWVTPPPWYNGSTKDKLGYGYYKELECGRKFGLFNKIPQN